MIDPQKLKRQVNIVEIINQFVPLKKQGKDYFGCCPFHGEKTPSFSVNEEKQFFHCFGCGQNGDVMDFLMEYHGWSFIEAAKFLGADVEAQPIAKTKSNEQRKFHSFKLPPDHSEDEEMASKMIESSSDLIPISTATGKVVNCYSMKLEQPMLGDSYNGAYWIIKNDKPNGVAVTSLELGNRIASIYGFNVAVCFTGAIMKYMCKWNSGDFKLKPVLSDHCDDYLAYDMPWLYWDGEKLEKKKVK